MKSFNILIFVILLFTMISCKNEKPQKNKVDIDQVNYDDSSNYNYIFKDTMEEEKRKKGKYKKKNDL